MRDKRQSPFYLLLGVVLGVAGVLSEALILRVLGGCALIVTAGLLVSGRRSDQESPDDPTGSIPELSLAERFLPWLFLVAAVLIVLALVVYTLR